jgi:hypothetical protein
MSEKNQEWLRSLSDKALRDEIVYGRILADGSDHAQHHARELEQARAELARRERRS